MTIHKHLLWIFCIFVSVIVSAVSIGCTRQKVEVSGVHRHQQLRAFVAEDAFMPPPGNIYPEPKATPAEVLAYATQRYDSDCDVRRLVVLYFLRYDSALLDRGLITASTDPQTLIGLLWQKEANGWAETPSTEMMRKHIVSATEKFCLKAPDKELLERNQTKFTTIMERWKKP
ncbi:MAG: hypothetical protein K8S55_10620 [Phycisphaerae bacterium]|nr:hypothetical protein [Phycisphaerae bacterium]